MVDILTGTAFGAPRRMHRREDEVALEFPSSVSSRARGLLALKAMNWRAAKTEPVWDDGYYIQSNGTQAVLVPYIPQVTDRIELDCDWTSGSSPFGACRGWRNHAIAIFGREAWSGSYSATVWPVAGSSTAGRRSYVIDSGRCYYNGELVHDFGVSSDVIAAHLTIFCSINSRDQKYPTSYAPENKNVMKLYSLKAFRGGELIHDYRPSPNQDGVVDLVDGAVYQSSIGGAFVYGTDTPS